mgnify:CR=1 FL=1|jgi:hypothetical protein
MKMLCLIGLHRWANNERWGSRGCLGCGHVEVRMYTKESGPYWERVS